jgi:hypothetical protein
MEPRHAVEIESVLPALLARVHGRRLDLAHPANVAL